MNSTADGRWRLAAVLLVFAALATGCQALDPFTRWFSPRSVVVTVQVTRSAPGMPTRTPDPACIGLLPGMGLNVGIYSGALVVEITGLQPGEQPVFVYDRGANGGRFEVLTGQSVGQDGRAVDQTLQIPDPAAVSGQTWEIRVVHVRGVACGTLRLP